MNEERLPQIQPYRGRLLRVGLTGEPLVVTAVAQDEPLLCVYTGSSMNPTLCEHDLLEVVPYTTSSPKVGDVVLFATSMAEQLVVHRIVRIADEKLNTRGDNNASVDLYSLSAEDLIGQVVGAWRGSERRPIRGGWLGLARAHMSRYLGAARRRLSRFLRPIFDALDALRLPQRLSHGRLSPRVVRFATGDEEKLRLLAGRHIVGEYDHEAQRWRIRPIHRLWVDRSALPSGASSPGCGERSTPQ